MSGWFYLLLTKKKVKRVKDKKKCFIMNLFYVKVYCTYRAYDIKHFNCITFNFLNFLTVFILFIIFILCIASTYIFNCLFSFPHIFFCFHYYFNTVLFKTFFIIWINAARQYAKRKYLKQFLLLSFLHVMKYFTIFLIIFYFYYNTI